MKYLDTNSEQPKQKITVPCCYQGGKQRVAKEIVDAIFRQSEAINDRTCFFDLCCGSGAITAELITRGIKPAQIVMLDISSWGLFWKTVGDGNFDLSTFDFYLNRIPQEKNKVKDYIALLAQEDATIDEVYKYIILQSCSFGGKQIWRSGTKWKNAFFRSYWEPTPTSVRRYPANPMQPSPNVLRARLINILKSCRGLKCIHDDISVMLDYDIPDNSVIYIDPPYKNTTGYAYQFDLMHFVSLLQGNTKAPIFISEGTAVSAEAEKLTFGGAKGGINGNKQQKHEEWLSFVG